MTEVQMNWTRKINNTVFVFRSVYALFAHNREGISMVGVVHATGSTTDEFCEQFISARMQSDGSLICS